MNYLWCGMILIGIVYAAFTGNMQAVTDAALASSREAVSLCISMLGVLALWNGLMEIAQKSGLTELIQQRLTPLLRFLFPKIPSGHPSRTYLAANITANLLGLGWAATPAGLKAMEELDQLEAKRRTTNAPAAKKIPKGTASDEMCTFLILNISSLQLIPVNIIAYRSQYGSVNPTAIVGPGIVATMVSTLVAVLFCKIMNSRIIK